MGALSSTAKVAVIDEQVIVRAGMEYWLAHEPSLTICASFAHPAECLAWLPAHCDVDVLVTEIQQNGHAPDVDCLRQLCQAVPSVVVHSRLTATEVILSSLDAGALSYVAKTDGKYHLITALRRASAGQTYVNPRMAEALNRSQTLGRLSLSDRERQVLTTWLRTDSKEDVAASLHIATATVRTHLQRVRTKYAHTGRPAPTKSALLARAIEDGIVGLSDLSTVMVG